MTGGTTSDVVRVSVRHTEDARVAELTLNRPQARNAITIELAAALRTGLRAAASSADVVVVRGAGGNFCAGGDFHEVSRLREEGPDALRTLFETFIDACESIAGLPVPVVAVVEGYAMAGGFELIQSVDVAVVRDDAVLADNHVNFGMIPGGGGSQRLPRIVGVPRALGHMLTGEPLSGTQAAEWGLVYRSLPAEEFETGVDALVRRLAGQDRDALARIKKLVRAGVRGSLSDGLAAEVEESLRHLSGEHSRPGMDAFVSKG